MKFRTDPIPFRTGFILENVSPWGWDVVGTWDSRGAAERQEDGESATVTGRDDGRDGLCTYFSNHRNNYGKSPCLMGKSTISMAIFNFQDLKVEKW